MVSLNAAATTGIKIYPNRIQPHQLITVEGLKDNRYKAVFTTTDGRQFVKDLLVQNGAGTFQPDEKHCTRGLYYVHFVDAAQNIYAGSKIMVQ